MAFDKSVIRAVNEDFARRRADAFDRVEKAKAQVFSRLPEIKELSLRLAATSASLVGLAAQNELTEERIKEIRAENRRLLAKRRELLAKNGYESHCLDLKFDCEACQDTGFIGSLMCDCYKSALRIRAYMSSPLAAAHPDADFATFRLDYYPDRPDGSGVSPRRRMEKNLETCRAFCRSFESQTKSLLMTGPTGLGKTFLSGCISRELISRGFDVMYETAHSVFSILEKDKFSPSAETADAAERLFNCDLLIVDDLGSEFVTAFSVSALYNLINTRLFKKRLMVINTNCTLPQLEESYSVRITSRILGEFHLLKFCGDDIRQLKRRLEQQ